MTAPSIFIPTFFADYQPGPTDPKYNEIYVKLHKKCVSSTILVHKIYSMCEIMNTIFCNIINFNFDPYDRTLIIQFLKIDINTHMKKSFYFDFIDGFMDFLIKDPEAIVKIKTYSNNYSTTINYEFLELEFHRPKHSYHTNYVGIRNNKIDFVYDLMCYSENATFPFYVSHLSMYDKQFVDLWHREQKVTMLYADIFPSKINKESDITHTYINETMKLCSILDDLNYDWSKELSLDVKAIVSLHFD